MSPDDVDDRRRPAASLYELRTLLPLMRAHMDLALWVRTFATVEELWLALLEWAHRYNEHWLLERYDFLSPSQARRELMKRQAA